MPARSEVEEIVIDVLLNVVPVVSVYFAIALAVEVPGPNTFPFAGVDHVNVPLPLFVRTLPKLPCIAGRVIEYPVVTAAACSVATPDVLPDKFRLLIPIISPVSDRVTVEF
jgi:hypothetical protein